MSRKPISSAEFFLCMNKIKAESIPVLAVFSSNEGVGSKIYGVLDSVSNELGLVFSTQPDTPSVCSTLVVPILSGCSFFRELADDLPEAEREYFRMKYGDNALSFISSLGSRLMVFFTDDSKL